MVSSKLFDEYLVVEIIVYYPKLLNWTKKKAISSPKHQILKI